MRPHEEKPTMLRTGVPTCGFLRPGAVLVQYVQFYRYFADSYGSHAYFGIWFSWFGLGHD